MPFEPTLTRRASLAAITGFTVAPTLLFGTEAANAAIPTDRLTVLYRRESDTAPNRLDPAVQTSTLALEDEFLRRGFQVVQPDARAYEVMDKGPAVIVTFSPDAGFSMVFSVYQDLRSVLGQDAAIAEVRLQARVLVGRHVLVADEGRGQMYTRQEAGSKEFGERRALDLAARRASVELAEKVTRRLRALSSTQINALVTQSFSPSVASAEVVRPAPPPAVAPVIASAPPAQPTPPAEGATPSPVAPVAAPPQSQQVASALDSAGTLPAPKNRWALVAGVSDYGPVRERLGIKKPEDLSDLRGVKVDVENVTRTLIQLGFPGKQVLPLLDEEVTSTAIRLYLKNLAGRVGPDDLVFVFISAHGSSKDSSVSGFGMPILADYAPMKVGNKVIAHPDTFDFWELQGLCKNLPTRNVVWVIDTCFSGNAARNLVTVEISGTGVAAVQGAAGPNASVVTSTANDSHNFLVITASAPNEVSQDTAKGGLFTSHFMDALITTRGAAPLGSVVQDFVLKPVVESSRRMCRARGADCKYPQQTPQVAYSGRGNQIRLNAR